MKLRVVFMLLLVALTMGCVQPRSTATPTSKLASLLEVRLQAPEVIALGEKAHLNLIVTNKTDNQVVFWHGIIPVFFQVFNATNEVVWPKQCVIQLPLGHTTFEPRETKEYSRDWAKEDRSQVDCDDPSTWGGNVRAAQPGTYFVQAGFGGQLSRPGPGVSEREPPVLTERLKLVLQGQ